MGRRHDHRHAAGDVLQHASHHPLALVVGQHELLGAVGQDAHALRAGIDHEVDAALLAVEVELAVVCRTWWAPRERRRDRPLSSPWDPPDLRRLQAAPFGDEQRRGLGDLADRFEVHPLVEAVDVVGLRAVDQRRDAGIEAEEAVVGRAGRGLVLAAPRRTPSGAPRPARPRTCSWFLSTNGSAWKPSQVTVGGLLPRNGSLAAALADQVLDLLPALLQGLRRQHARRACRRCTRTAPSSPSRRRRSCRR